MRVSYADLFGLKHEIPDWKPVHVGDEVVTGRNSGPHYRVLAVVDDKAWIRGLNRGHDHIVSVRRLRTVQPSNK